MRCLHRSRERLFAFAALGHLSPGERWSEQSLPFICLPFFETKIR